MKEMLENINIIEGIAILLFLYLYLFLSIYVAYKIRFGNASDNQANIETDTI